MKRTTICLGLVLIAGMLAGCGSRVSRENYERIQTGMTLQQVQDIMGNRGVTSEGVAGAIGDLAGSASVYRWVDENRAITVTFINGKVVSKGSEGM